jgi:GTP-binding protein YchF
MLSVGIIGLPNVGKSTLFNALSAGQAEVSNYPFTTISCNVGVVAVPDPRLYQLEELLSPAKTTPCCIRFIDIAGLVKGASQGEGLGNQFLGEIRQVDAIAHVLRCFESSKTAHVFGDVDPIRDAEVVETELLLADLEVLGRAMNKRQRDWQTYPREHQVEQQRMHRYQECLEQGKSLRSLDLGPEEQSELKALGLLTGRPILYVANVSDAAEESSSWVAKLAAWKPDDAEVVGITADLEWELQELDPQERQEMMAELGFTEPGLERLVKSSFKLLSLISFYTVVKSKLQSWEIKYGTTAPKAAGKVHSDMEKGFIRAQVAPFEELCRHGSLHELQTKGLIRTVGKEYQVEDGDVIEFLFSA